MLGRILDNLRRYPEDECYQIKDKIYKNKDLYKYACNIYQYLLERCSYQDLIVVCGHKEIYMIASFLACTFAVTSDIVEQNKEISIGVPKKDTDIYIVDEKLETVNDNEIGEMIIVGNSVGKGYVDENLNINRFITYEGRPAYVTGDLARKNNGKYYYVGRKDRQIKYKGYRIELSEIEKVLNDLDCVDKAVVTTNQNEEGIINRIIAFIVIRDNSGHNVRDIKEAVGGLLPDYMLPAIKIVDSIPLNENGKFNERIMDCRKNEG